MQWCHGIHAIVARLLFCPVMSSLMHAPAPPCAVCRASHKSVEDILDILGDTQLPEALRRSIPDNFRAMLSMLEVEFNLEISKEFVYGQCPDCSLLYRGQYAKLDMCPICDAARYEESPCGKLKDRAQVCPAPHAYCVGCCVLYLHGGQLNCCRMLAACCKLVS